MNHPILAAASGVLFGCVLSASAYLMHLHPDFVGVLSATETAIEAPIVPAPVPVAVSSQRLEADPPEPESPQDCSSPEVTLRAAQRAYISGDYDEAISLAELCTDVEPHRAMRIIGAASCVLHDLDCLKTAYRASDAPSRQYLVYVCQRNGVSFHQRGKHLVATVDRRDKPSVLF